MGGGGGGMAGDAVAGGMERGLRVPLTGLGVINGAVSIAGASAAGLDDKNEVSHS